MEKKNKPKEDNSKHIHKHQTHQRHERHETHERHEKHKQQNIKPNQTKETNPKNQQKTKTDDKSGRRSIENIMSKSHPSIERLKPLMRKVDNNSSITSHTKHLFVLTKTAKKAKSPNKDFQLSVKKVKNLKDKGYSDLVEIGHGSYGKIYRANSAKYNKVIAIKVIDLKLLSKEFLQKFMSIEIDLMRKLSEHKNVTKFYDIIEGTDDQILCIAMELYSKGDLFEYLIRRQYIPERQACLWFKQLISGVQHIHRNGFAHRDLKCENILLNDEYIIKIIDFGFCCRIRYGTTVVYNENKEINFKPSECSSQTYCGSYVYSSPEILKAQPYLPTRADVWSCGVILYVMLFGQYPNDGHEMMEFLQNDNHFIEIPKTPEVSKECKQLLSNILVKEYKRYSIEKILTSDWFKKEWDPIGDDVNTTEYFENLNIRRIETEGFVVSESDESVKSLEI